jgi:cytochrome c oxidase subunit 2
MTSTGVTIIVAYSALTIIGVVIGLIVYRSTRVGFRVNTASRSTLEKREGYWGVAVIAFLVVVLAGTMVQIPYWKSKRAGKTPQTINIVGRQFAWTVNPVRVRAGLKTRVVVRTTDVNHGVGVYDPDQVMIKQVNVAPGVTQEFIITFDKPGTYKLRCMEFCGVDHHLMQNTLEVTR